MKQELSAVNILFRKIQIVRNSYSYIRLTHCLANTQDWLEEDWSTLNYLGSNPVLQVDNDWDEVLHTYDLKAIIENSYEATCIMRGGRKFMETNI